MANLALLEFSDLPEFPQSLEGKTVKVLHVINGEFYSGAERVQDLLATALPEHGFQVGFACIKPGRFPGSRFSTHAPLYRLPMRGRFDLRPIPQLVQRIRREGYRLLHAHTPRSLLIAGLASRPAGVPLVYHAHSPTSRDSTRRWQNRLNAALERGCMRLAGHVIAVSQSLQQHLRQLGVAEDRITVVRNGVPCRQPRPTRANFQEDWVLGTVALFRPRKGIELLLEALAILRRQGLPVSLRAVGGFETADYQREVEGVVRRLGLAGAVTWTGFTTDVGTELNRMDVFVLPSLFGEGLPMVVLEAMAAGVPVVATRVEGVPEVIRDGCDGLLAQPGNARDLAGAVARMLRGEVNWWQLRESALERHAGSFSDRCMAEGVAGVYRRVLGG